MNQNVRIIKTYTVRILVILVLISSLLIMQKIEPNFLAHSNGTKTLDMRFGYNFSDVTTLFTNLGQEGRLTYIKYLCDDFIFTISYALVQNYILKFIMGKVMLNSKWRILLTVAYIRAIFDVSENIIILILLNSFPSMPLYLISAANSVTRIKFIFLALWILSIPVSLAARIIIRKKSEVI